MSWAIVQSASGARSVFLKKVLEQRFPKTLFCYFRFSTLGLKNDALNANNGLILEMKELSPSQIPLFDRFYQIFKDRSIILIVTPRSYNLLKSKRSKKLLTCMPVISDLKSLDYLLQIPRLIDEVKLRNRLRNQNERLKRLIAKTQPHRAGFQNDSDLEVLDLPESKVVALYQDTEGNPKSGFTLKIKIKRWPALSKTLGPVGQNEFVSLLTRSIHDSIRQSDRIYRSQEDEFLVFISMGDGQQMNTCSKRIKHTLSTLEVKANDKSMTLPFEISIVR